MRPNNPGPLSSATSRVATLPILPLSLLCAVLVCRPAAATEVAQFGGTHADWPAAWTLLDLNDPEDGMNDYVDIVGDTLDPAAYWAQGNGYFYFRIRVDAGTFDASANDARNSWFLMVNAVDYTHPNGGTDQPDFAFVWDLKAAHGLEMLEIDTAGSRWSDLTFDDIDGNSGQKISPPDFSESGGDGYIRTIDGVATENFGTSTFIDFAISSLYLAAQVPALLDNPEWALQIGTIENANDHNFITSDISASQTPLSVITPEAWSTPQLIPEPLPALSVLALLVPLALVYRRTRRRFPPSSDGRNSLPPMTRVARLEPHD